MAIFEADGVRLEPSAAGAEGRVGILRHGIQVGLAGHCLEGPRVMDRAATLAKISAGETGWKFSLALRSLVVTNTVADKKIN